MAWIMENMVIKPWSCHESRWTCQKPWPPCHHHGMIMIIFRHDHGMIMARSLHGSHIFPSRGYHNSMFWSTNLYVRAVSERISSVQRWKQILRAKKSALNKADSEKIRADQRKYLSCSPNHRWKTSNLRNSTAHRWISLGLQPEQKLR